MSTAQGLIEVARLVKADGWPVEFVPGWQRRGRGPVAPRTAVNHWTAGPRTGDHPSLRVVTHGRKGLRNALANTYSSRRPKLYIVAANTAWHAGRGSWRGVSGNSAALGHEAENSGQGEWTDDHLALIASLDRAQLEVFGYGVQMVCDHFEWTRRKIDRNDVGGQPWRDRLTHGAQEDDDMTYQEGDEGPEVRLIQTRLKQIGHPVTVDGIFGPETRDYVAHYQDQDPYLTPTGKVDWFTFVKLTNDAHGAVVSH